MPALTEPPVGSATLPTAVRRAVCAAVLTALLAPLTGPIPHVVAASAPKVVIIVGPVAGTTPSYRSDADAAAAAALRYTPNVIKLYSPNATWDMVKPALQGASIVIYMGHGNGFPSPYSSTLQPDRQNGLALNPTAGGDDSATRYWGEQFLASDVRLAPNAVVLLGHLCYASGSSEPGSTDPSRSVAQQRVDNFAAGFLAAGARAVIAEAYGGASAHYVDALFTAHDSIGNIWANSFSKQANAFSFASTRTPGMTVQMDPDKSSGKYWRAIVGDMSLASDAVVSGSAPVGSTTPPALGILSPGPTPTPLPSPVPVTAGLAPTPTASPTPSPSPLPAPSVPAVTVGSPPPPEAAKQPSPQPNSVLWTTTVANIRGHPTVSTSVLFVVPAATPLRLARIATDVSGRTWYLVRVHGRRGWIASWLTQSSRPGLSSAGTSPTWQTAGASSFGVGDGLLGSPKACGGTLTDTVMAVANLALPCGTHVQLQYGGHIVEAVVLDRGPYVTGLSFDLAPAVCAALGDCGVITLQWQALS